MLGHLATKTKKILDPYLIPYTKLNCWCIYRPRCEPQIHIFFCAYLYDLELEKDFSRHKNKKSTEETD